MSSRNLQPALKLPSYWSDCKPRTRYFLSCSDASPIKQAEVLAMADAECKAMWDDLELAYGHPWGHPVLRQEVAKLHGMTQDDVLVNVPQGAIYIAINVLVPYLTQKSGLEKIHVITCRPTYGVLYMNAQNLGCDIDLWSARFTSNGWSFDIEDLKPLVKENTCLLIVNFPHNPTGFTPSLEDFKKLTEFCKSHKIFLFCDEIFKFTGNDGQPSLPSACELYDDAMTLFGMSKTLAQPGLSIGWVVSRDHKLLKLMVDYKHYINNCSSVPAEIFSIITLRNMDKVLKRNMSIILANLKLLDEFFAEYSDIFEWHRPKAGIVSLVKIKGWAAELGEGCASGFCESLLNDVGVMLTPSRLFETDDDYFRIGFGRKDLPEGLAQIKTFLNKMRPNTVITITVQD